MKKERKDIKNLKEGKRLKGIEGWLLLQFVVLILVAIALIADFFTEFFGKTPEEIARSFLYSSQVLDGFILIITIIIIIKFWKQEASTPKWMIGWYLIWIVHWFFDVTLFSDFFSDMGHWFSALTDTLFAQIVISLVWITYFIKSRRVKNTFIK